MKKRLRLARILKRMLLGRRRPSCSATPFGVSFVMKIAVLLPYIGLSVPPAMLKPRLTPWGFWFFFLNNYFNSSLFFNLKIKRKVFRVFSGQKFLQIQVYNKTFLYYFFKVKKDASIFHLIMSLWNWRETVIGVQ